MTETTLIHCLGPSAALASVLGTSSARRLALPPGRPGNGRRPGDLPGGTGQVGARPPTLLGGDSGAGRPCPIVPKVKALKQGGATWPQENDLPRRMRTGWERAAQSLYNFIGHASQPCSPNNKIPPSVNAQVSLLLLPSKSSAN